ncbi:DNA-binding protein [Jeotgalibacillus malaysiensis]|uniref:DNA-binding protein n=1 Tax=Jeotgalibacillus malaysiensis TaxID=1508404 RepID=A0A0B5ARH2_9BACL|nr:cupin domain-containing protein [Jeotgalibacillus malaysiensis]AJD90679.1 DNA-binding protein [Jeotgalibacillus malaysiensis]
MDEIKKQLGGNLRLLRKNRDLSLDRLALLTGVSKAMLGQIERGDANPSVGTIWKIANGLKISFSSLLAAPVSDVTVIRAEAVEMLEEDNGRYRVYPIFTFDPVRQWEGYRVELDPGCHYHSESHGSGVEEYMTVIEGELIITVSGNDYTLKSGDSIRFKADQPHDYHNKADQRTVCQMVIHYNEG